MIAILPKKKLLFWRLASIFILITLVTLLSLWGSGKGLQSNQGMMSQSMGAMMLQMHTRNITLSDLIYQNKMTEQMSSMGMHHSSASGSLKTSHYITTLVMVLLLPFVLASGVFLLIVWWK